MEKRLVDEGEYENALKAWTGPDVMVQVWVYNVSLQRMVLRLSRTPNESLWILGVNCSNMTGRLYWRGANLELARVGTGYHAAICVLDRAVNFSLWCSSVVLGLDPPDLGLPPSF